MTTERNLLRRGEHFGFDTTDPWSLPALRLLFHAPRAFAPLVEAWEHIFPGTNAALARLTDLGFVAYQAPVVIDARSQAEAESATRAVDRFRITEPGTRLLSAIYGDQTAIRDVFPRLTEQNTPGVIQLLEEFAVNSTIARSGRSLVHIAETGLLPRRTTYYWGEKFLTKGLIRKLPDRAPDAMDAIPAHWRVTRALSLQLRAAIDAYPNWAELRTEFQLTRTKYLQDINVRRVSKAGGTDYDHDVNAQTVLVELLASPALVSGAPVELEPHFRLPLDNTHTPFVFTGESDDAAYYQPDAMLTARLGTNTICALEYERFQSRRAAWSHIERLIGWLSIYRLPFEAARLLFVVDTARREEHYTALIEAFADYAEEHPERMCPNDLTLGVASRERLENASDALHDSNWFRVQLPTGPGTQCVLHNATHSPYNHYFATPN